MPGFTSQHQSRLKNSSVIIIGIGGLGNPVAQYLASAGVGRMTLIDHDSSELSNLHRQPFFSESDIGRRKASVAQEKLKVLSSECTVDVICERFDAGSGIDFCKNHDLIIDCCDLPSTKRAIDAVAFALKIPLICGAVSRFDGQVTVFHGEASTRYNDLFPQASDASADENCETLGIWGPAAGIIGNIMAQEALRILAFGRSQLEGKLMHFDLMHYECVLIDIPSTQRPSPTPIRHLPESVHLIRRAAIAGLVSKHPQMPLIELSDESASETSGNSMNFTLESLIWASTEWSKEKPLLLSCRHGNRSFQAALFLAAEGFEEIYCVSAETASTV